MQTLVFLLVAVLFASTLAENCTVQTIYEVLRPVAFDDTFATCQTESNYTLLSFANPSLNQSEAFCASSACQALLNATLSSGLLPDCEVVIGMHSLNLSDAITIAAKCGSTWSLEERAVSKTEGDDQLGHTTDNVVTVVGHSVPMDELSEPAKVLSAMLSLFLQ